ncbi:MAG TPA: DUF1330 domain-containing protein [Actinopolymorphaceae bacterium]
MTAYGIAHLRREDGPVHPDVIEYIERIQSTLDPYGGRFLVHGNPVQVLEGSWEGDLVMIEFPDLDRAREWYESPAYQAILPLRTKHLEGDVLLVGGVAPDYDPAETAAKLRGSRAGS